MKKKIILLFIPILLFAYFIIKDSKSNKGIFLADKITGDVNSDGKVSSVDYVLVKKYLLKKGSLTTEQKKNADVNGDSKISSADYVMIKKIIMGDRNTTKKESSNVADIGDSYIVFKYNVVDFGADPTGTKDSTKAFQDALNKANSCTNKYYDTPNNPCGDGNVVYVPKGKYKITSQLNLNFHTALVGSNMNDTILMLYYGKNTTDYNKSALVVGVQALVKNLSFWYPEQTLSGGKIIPYPPTILQAGIEGLTLENLRFVNSYTAMDFKSKMDGNALHFVRNIYGTPLSVGIINDSNLDTSRIQNLNFAASYWLNSGLGVPNANTLNNILKTNATGIISERVDWAFYSDVTINGYSIGFRFRLGNKYWKGYTIGAYYNINMNDCSYPIYVDGAERLSFTKSSLNSSGGGSAINIPDASANISISNSTLTGVNSLYSSQKSNLIVTESKLIGKIIKNGNNTRLALVNNNLSSTGMDGNNATNTEVLVKENPNYKKVPTSKPSAKYAVMISASNKADITSKIKEAITNAKNNGGGIVYIPLGKYIVKDSFTVPSGVEIQGAIPWGHNINSPTELVVEYSGSNPLFILEANSGMNGLTISYPDSRKEFNKNYVTNASPTIQGRGSNIYVRNINIENGWIGIDMASYRCDNHYIERIWGYFYRYGIKIGAGSSNGIIKDCHFQVATYRHYNGYQAPLNDMMNNQISYQIGNSTNEVLFNDFVFGSKYGFHITNNAKNVFILGGGGDICRKALLVEGNATVQVVNSFMVNNPYREYEGYSNFDPHIEQNNSVKTESNFTGKLDLINTMAWGNYAGTSYDLHGTGTVNITAGQIYDSTSPIIRIGVKNFTLSGTSMCFDPTKCFTANGKSEIEASQGSSSALIAIPICMDGNCEINNTANIPISIAGEGESTSIPNSSTWTTKTLSNTRVSGNNATTTICGFDSNAKTIEYSTNSDGNKTQSITNGCATITISAKSGQQLKYKVINKNGSTTNNTVNNIGKYLLIAQIYNYLLHQNPASNNEQNLTAWVKSCSDMKSCLAQIGTVAINEIKDSNEEFIKNIYKSILGREADTSGLNSWVNSLNNGTTRSSVLNGFIASEEAIKIYSLWGY